MPTIPPRDDPPELRQEPFNKHTAGTAGRDISGVLLRLSGWLFVALVLGTAVAMVLGSRLPERHSAAVEVVVPMPPQRVRAMLTDVARQTRWRAEIDGVDDLQERGGLPCWTERHGRLAVPLCLDASHAPWTATAAVSDARLPLQGEWRFVLEAASPTSTRVRIEESTLVASPLWRFYLRYVRGEGATLRELAVDLETAGVNR